MNGATITSSVSVGSVPTTWTVQETGDFFGVGKSSILWLDTSGDVAIWQMNGGTIASTVSVGTVPAGWTVLGTNVD
jgi:hypothetical protein